ncbi:MAG: hypothetical protein AAFY20_24345 [Cyanobacteria bacterium J06639_14]
MTAPDAATVQSLRNVLDAYIEAYGGGESLSAIRAIAGSILSVQARAKAISLKGLEIEAWVDAIVTDFELGHLAEKRVDKAAHAIALQVKSWSEKLELKTSATLDAYIQTYTPDLNTTKPPQIPTTVATILPIVADTAISSDEAKRIIHLISRQFDWHSAVDRVVDAKWIFLAGKVRKALQNRDIEATVQDVVQAYVSKFKPVLVEMGEGLAEQALTALLNSQTELDLDIDLDPESQRLVIQQVSFKMRLIEASPAPSKTALEIAQQIRSAVTRHREKQGLDNISLLPPVTQVEGDTASSSIGGDISIGIEIHPGSESQNKPS